MKHGAYKFWDWLAGQLIACSITVFLLSLGIGYMIDDERLEEATVIATKQAGGKEIANGYDAFWRAMDDTKKQILSPLPKEWQEPLKAWSLRGAAVVLLAGIALLVFRAPTRAHAAKEVGWGIAAPGVLGAFATLVLEWRAMKGIKATLTGQRDATTLWIEGRDAAIQCIFVLWPALLAGLVAVAFGVLCEKRWRHRHLSRLTPLHVVSHFLIVGGAVPWLHYLSAIVLDAFTVGSSTGASMAPYTSGPLVYLACTSLFALGASLWFLARAEVKRIEAEEA